MASTNNPFSPKAFDPAAFMVDEPLRLALEGARQLGQPLLLTGAPGTGKTRFADWAVDYLNKEHGGYHPELLTFVTKTTSTAKDLFYTYDALGHFQAAHRHNESAKPAESKDFIEVQALGQAILMSNPSSKYAHLLDASLRGKAQSTVVLIDEVDKAPRDFTNDILDEIDRKRFAIKELGKERVEKGADADIVVILTSNSEKNLPDAFLRRCAFYHISDPDKVKLRAIVLSNLGGATGLTEKALDPLLDFFLEVKNESVRKPPATAELLAWIRLLGLNGYFEGAKNKDDMLFQNLSFLVKTEADLKAVKGALGL